MSTTTTRMRQPATDRSGCDAPQHGTRTAYRRHGCRCDDAREAHAQYQRARLAGRTDLVANQLVDATGTRRRIQALYALGHREADLAARLGYTRTLPWMHHSNRTRIYSSIAEKVATLYEELSGTPGPSKALRSRAPALGWYPPLAWDGVNIDDPNAVPDTGSDANDDDLVDEIAVLRASSGSLPATHMRRVDRLAAITTLVAKGLTSREVADRLHTTTQQVNRDRNTLNRRKAKRTQGAD